MTEDRRCDVPLTQHLWGPDVIIVGADSSFMEGNRFGVESEFTSNFPNGYNVSKVSFTATPEHSIRATDIRDAQIGSWGSLSFDGDLVWWSTDDGRTADWEWTKTFIRDFVSAAGKRLHPSGEVLQLVGIVFEYSLCRVIHNSNQWVADLFQVPLRTAARWIRLAKDRWGFTSEVAS
jgi:hypothetical protein